MTHEMKNKVILITGATNGIGKATALALARKAATLVIVGRNPEKTRQVASEIAQQSGNPAVDFLLADLSVLSQVRSLAEAFKQKYSRMDVLINNAGSHFSNRQLTADGYERTFSFNHLSYFLLTHEFLDLVKGSAPARIINVSSAAHTLGPLNFDDLMSTNYGMMGFRAYSQSKLANIMFTYELARRLDGTGVTVNALHPGAVNTGFAKNNSGWMRFTMNLFGYFSLTPEAGALTSIYLASSPTVSGVNGKYFDKCKPVSSSPASYDQAAQQRLWALSEELTGIKYPV